MNRWTLTILCGLGLLASCSTADVECTSNEECAPGLVCTGGDCRRPAGEADADTDTDLDAEDAAPDAEADTTPDVAPDTTPDTAPDTTPDVTPDTAPDTAPDTTPDTTRDVAPDATPDVDDPVCGDGTLADAEGCDDGNRRDGDGCSADCEIETGCEPMAFDPEGSYLLTLRASLDAARPFYLALTIRNTARSGRYAVQIEPLGRDDSPHPRAFVGNTVLVPDAAISSEGDFSFVVNDLVIPELANAITVGSIDADIVLNGTFVTGDTDVATGLSSDAACGAVEGEVTSPLPVSLGGSTFSMVRMDGVSPRDVEVAGSCALLDTPRVACAGAPVPERCFNDDDDDDDGDVDCGDADCADDRWCDGSMDAACLGADDSYILDTNEDGVVSESRDCGLGCLGDADLRGCSTACVSDATGLSSACASCYSDVIICTVENCLAPCAADPSSTTCLTCQAEYCDSLDECTGRTPGRGWQRNDGFTDGDSAGFQGGFNAGERAAACFDVPGPYRVTQLAFLFGGDAPGATRLVDVSLWSRSSPTGPPTTMLAELGDREVVSATDAMTTLDLAPFGWTGTGPFCVAIELQTAGLPSVARDIDGTIDAAQNYIYADGLGPGGAPGWVRSADLLVAGDWVIRAYVE